MIKKAIKRTAEEINSELDKALVLLKSSFGFEPTRPDLYVGEKHFGKFIQISSLRDLVRAANIQMVYDDEINGIFVPDTILFVRDWPEKDYDRVHRIYCFIHENMHAFIAQKNFELKEGPVNTLINSRLKSKAEKGQVYHVFNEGLATYIATQAVLQCSEPTLIRKGQKEHQELLDAWNEWLSSRGLDIMAKAYNIERNEPRKILLKYFQDVRMAIVYYRYTVGYAFMHTIQPDKKSIEKMINFPPSKFEHLLWPETYLEILKTSKGA